MNSMLQRLFQTLVIACLGTACSQSEAPELTVGADTVYRNGRIYTVDATRSWAQAVAVTAGRISYVGSDAGADAHIGSNTAVIDLDGRMMLPAFPHFRTSIYTRYPVA